MKSKRYLLRIFILIFILTFGGNLATYDIQAASRAFTLNKTSIKIALEKTYTLKVSNTSGKIVWKTSNSKVASVTEGVITAKAVGSVTITASCNAGTKSCKVTVYQPAKSVKLTTNSYLEVGDTFTVNAAFTPENATYQKLTWSVKDDWWSAVENVSGNKFKAVEEGTSTIVAYQKDTKKTYQLKVTVKAALGSFHIESDNEKVTALATYPGHHLLINAVFDEDYWGEENTNQFTYSVSNPSVALVDEKGQISGISEGTATISATAVNGKSAQCKLVVAPLPKDIMMDQFLASDMTEKIGAGGYSWLEYYDEYNFASVDNTQMIPLTDGRFAIFNCTYSGNKNIIVTYSEYNQSFQCEEEKKLELPYTEWGGAYLGTDGYYYLAAGQTNKEESDSKTVYTIIKYDKALTEMGRCNITGAECKTTVPFDAGNCSMDMNGTTLVVYTSRERYTSDDGKNHQSNITFVIDTLTMKQSYVGGLFPYNHVSHSFNQFVKFDSGNLIYVDHGDAYPRSVVMQTHNNFLQQPPFGNNNLFLIETNLLTIKGNTGDNNTGTRVAGLEIGPDHNLVAGTSIPHDTLTGDIADYTTKNVYVALASKDGSSSELKWLTDYKEGSNISVSNLRFVKINDDKFAIIYQIDKKDSSSIGFLLIDSNGTILQKKEFKGYFTGDVQPVVYQDSIICLQPVVDQDSIASVEMEESTDDIEDTDNLPEKTPRYKNKFMIIQIP